MNRQGTQDLINALYKSRKEIEWLKEQLARLAIMAEGRNVASKAYSYEDALPAHVRNHRN